VVVGSPACSVAGLVAVDSQACSAFAFVPVVVAPSRPDSAALTVAGVAHGWPGHETMAKDAQPRRREAHCLPRVVYYLVVQSPARWLL